MSVEPEYITARSVLLDGLDALHEHLPEIVLIGAQAVYLWAGAGDLRVAVMTTDADLALDASALKPNPRVEAALEVAGFAQRPGGNPGQWINRNGVALDLMVAEHQAGGGSRAARIPPHSRNTARRGRGLAPSLVDNHLTSVHSLATNDSRSLQIRVSGPAALIVAKCIKLKERLSARDEGKSNRVKPKDALDIFRLLQAVEMEQLLTGFSAHTSEPHAHDESLEALQFLSANSISASSALPQLARVAAEDDPLVSRSFVLLVSELMSALGPQR